MKFKIHILFISLLLFSCKEYKEINVTDVEDLYINKLTTDNLEVEIKLKINNPNNIGFSIYPSEFDIVFSGIRLGKAQLNKRVYIDATSEKVYSFILNKNVKDLNPFDALKLLNTNNIGKIEITGDLNVGKFYLKKKYPINYNDKVKLFN
jgi:LEA14-like dessication related protein